MWCVVQPAITAVVMQQGMWIRLGNCCSNTKIYSMSPTEGVVMGDTHRHSELAKGLSKASE